MLNASATTSTITANIATRYPYPGLRPFEPHEADIFFGRKRHVTDLLKRLKSQRFLAVVGPSGCGKSSLIRAGLIPSLRAGFMARNQCHWNFAVFRPGNQPLMRLAEALHESEVFGPTEGQLPQDATRNIQYTKQGLEAGSRSLADRLMVNSHAHGRNLLILVDQFEELFRFEGTGGGDESRAFVNLLLETARDPDISAYVVLTMRTDFIGQCPVFAGLPEALNESQYLTPRLTREQIESAIVGPARMFDSDVEPDVVNRILNEMGTDPDQLPLMQHLLMRMWRAAIQRDGKFKEDSEQRLLQGQEAELDWSSVRLTMQDYKDTGGLLNALGQHAQGIYEVRLTTERQKSLAEQMFRRLTEVAPNGQLVRCSPAPKFGELCKKLEATEEELAKVIDVFRREGRSFLMPPPLVHLEVETPIDISHESLIRNWPLLNEWTKDEALADQIEAEVTKSATIFEQGGHKAEDAAMPESRLAVALEWARKHPHDVTEEVQAFLDACVKTRDQSKRARRHLLIVSGVATLFTVAAILSAWQQQKSAALLSQRFWRDAVQQLNAVSQGKEDLAAALIWASQARQEEPQTLWLGSDRKRLYELRFNSILAQHPETIEVTQFPGQTVKAHSHNLRYVVTVDTGSSELRVTDRQGSYTVVNPYKFEGTLSDIKFDSQDRFMLVLSRNKHNVGVLTLYSLRSAGLLSRMELPEAADMDLQAADFVPGTADAAQPSVVGIVRRSAKSELNPSDAPPTRLMLWSSFTSKPESFSVLEAPPTRVTLTGPKAVSVSPTQLAISPDGHTVAAWGNVDRAQCGSLSIWDIDSRQLRFHDAQTQTALVTAAFSKTGHQLLTLDEGGKARLWDPVKATGLTDSWSAHVGPGQKAWFAPDEKNALTIGADNVARLWELPEVSKESPSSTANSSPVLRTAFPHESDIYNATFSRDGKLLATAGRDRLARVWDVELGQLAVPPLHHASGVDQAHFIEGSAGPELLTTTVSVVQRWRLTAKNPSPQTTMPLSFEGSKDLGALEYVACSENGRYAAIATVIDEVVHVDIWDSETRSVVNTKPLVQTGLRSISYAAVSDSGRRLLVVANEETPEKQTGLLWNCDNREQSSVTKLWSGALAARRCAAFTRDASTLLVASEHAGKPEDDSGWQLEIWNSGRSQLPTPEVVPNIVAVNHIAWSANGDMFTLALKLKKGNEENGAAMLYRWTKEEGLKNVRIWHHTVAKPIASGNAVLHSVFSSDGMFVATGGVDDTAYLWSIKSDDAVSPPLKHTSDIVHLAISPDNKYLATSSVADMNTCVWLIKKISSRSRQPSPLFTFTHGAAVNRAVFSHDSQWLATASNDKLARVWSLNNGELAAQLRHAGNVRGVAFSKDDSRLATISDSSLTDRLSQLPKESWPRLYQWHLRPTDPKSVKQTANIVDHASLLVASELNKDKSFLRMFAPQSDRETKSGTEFADAKYKELWERCEQRTNP